MDEVRREEEQDLRKTYLAVSPDGRLFSSSGQGRYIYSHSLLVTNFLDALEKIDFDVEKYIMRGGIYEWEKGEL